MSIYSDRAEGVHVDSVRLSVGGRVSTKIRSLTVDGRAILAADPDDENLAEEIVKAFVAAGIWRHIPVGVEDTHAHRRRQVQAALRGLIAPPRPKEPTGLGAVVEDSEGRRYLRFATPGNGAEWRGTHDQHDAARYWDEVPAIRILSEGVAS